MAKRYPTVPQVADPIETLLKQKCVTHDVETSISRLVKIVELPVNVPRYRTCHAPIVATGKQGSAAGELYHLRGVAIHQDTHQIFVANYENHRVEIFSETGEFVSQLGVGQLYKPWGIAIHGDSVYISCLDHTVNKFSLIEMCHVRRIGSEGSNNGQFDLPRQLTTDSISRVFIADSWNDRICMHDPDLNHLRNITHQSMSRPNDVKVSRDRLYVLCPFNSPCMHILTFEGDKIHSLFDCRGFPRFFSLDPLNNFVLSGWRTHSVRIFSPEGNLLHNRQINKQTSKIFVDRTFHSMTHKLISHLELWLLHKENRMFLVVLSLFLSCVGDYLLERRHETSESPYRSEQSCEDLSRRIGVVTHPFLPHR